MSNPSTINMDAVRALLGFRHPVPISQAEMIRNLKVVFVPGTRTSPRLQSFGRKLRAAFSGLGIREITVNEALNSSEQLVEGVVPIYLGEPRLDMFSLQQLPLQNLYSSQIVGIFDRKSPVNEGSDLQTRLDAITGVMTTSLVTLCIFVTDSSWVMCTMNGAVVSYDNGESITTDVSQGLVPKLAARVIPPRIADITCRYETFDPTSPVYSRIVADFVSSARDWAKSGLIGAHTSLDRLHFQSPLHKLFITSFLNDRSGMSYGFLSWQLPTACEPALTMEQARHEFGAVSWDGGTMHKKDGRRHLRVRVAGTEYVVSAPDVSVICTRSGCKKDQLNPERDLVRLTLSDGIVIMETPKGITKSEDCHPSYDTFTILGSAMGNCLVASVLMLLQPGAKFPQALISQGLSLSHWHGYLSADQIPPGHVMHGMENPGVCCSTQQSAIFASVGKLKALEIGLTASGEFLGDVHIEPHHGTNFCGLMSLSAPIRNFRQT